VNDFRSVICEQDDRGLFALVREPGDIVLSAGGWDDVWVACPEFDVPWRSVSFKNNTVRTAVLTQ
jgi:hypothetical protein